MTVKFKIGFTIGAETLFGMLSKFLPIENLAVEELVEKPKPTLAERAIAIAHRTTEKVGKPQRKKFKRASPGPNLSKGINGIIMVALADGPKRPVDIQPKVVAAGFSANSVTSRLEELRKYGVLEHSSDGLWRKK
jgi:hypothetical protein